MPSSSSSISSVADTTSIGSLVSAARDIFSNEDMAELKSRLLLMAQRLTSLGPPLPTPAFALPAEDASCAASCKLCRRRYRSTRNPYPGRGKSPFLCPARPGAAVCQSCRNVKNWAFQSWDMADLQTQCDTDDVFHTKFMLIVFVYEDKARVVVVTGSHPYRRVLIFE